MGVPSEAPERRGKLRRPIGSALAVAAFALLMYLYAPLPAPHVAPPSAGDCVELQLFSNGYHSDIGAPAALFPADHPLRRLYPDAREFLIGWGDDKFYHSDGTNLWLGLDALIPPSPSVMHVAYNAPYAAAYLSPTDDTAVAISHEGAARFVAYVDRALVLTPGGAVTIVSPGKVIGRSSFLRTRGSFHLFNVCNQWMARALRAAGIDVNARAAWLAGGLIHQVRRTGRTACPA
jgi:Protein of unknown function (DUF2459)